MLLKLKEKIQQKAVKKNEQQVKSLNVPNTAQNEQDTEKNNIKNIKNFLNRHVSDSIFNQALVLGHKLQDVLVKPQLNSNMDSKVIHLNNVEQGQLEIRENNIQMTLKDMQNLQKTQSPPEEVGKNNEQHTVVLNKPSQISDLPQKNPQHLESGNQVYQNELEAISILQTGKLRSQKEDVPLQFQTEKQEKNIEQKFFQMETIINKQQNQMEKNHLLSLNGKEIDIKTIQSVNQTTQPISLLKETPQQNRAVSGEKINGQNETQQIQQNLISELLLDISQPLKAPQMPEISQQNCQQPSVKPQISIQLQEQLFYTIVDQMKIITKLSFQQSLQEKRRENQEVTIEIQPLYDIQSLIAPNQQEQVINLFEEVQSEFSEFTISKQTPQITPNQISKQLLNEKSLLIAKFRNQTLPKQFEILFGNVSELYQAIKIHQKTIFCLDLIKENKQLILLIPIFDKKKEFRIKLEKMEIPAQLFLERKNIQLVQQMKNLYKKFTLTKTKYHQLKEEIEKYEKVEKIKQQISHRKNLSNHKGKNNKTQTDGKTREILKNVLKRDYNSRDEKALSLSQEEEAKLLETTSEAPTERSLRKKTKKTDSIASHVKK